MHVIADQVDMIATFMRHERPHPVRFRWEDRYGNVRVIRVEHIAETTEEKVGGFAVFKYLCQSMIEGRERTYELRFMSKNAQWILYKY